MMVSQGRSGMGRARIIRGGNSVLVPRNWINFRVSVDLLPQSLTLGPGESDCYQASSKSSCTLEPSLAKFQPSIRICAYTRLN
jgi:hypothetical protein